MNMFWNIKKYYMPDPATGSATASGLEEALKKLGFSNVGTFGASAFDILVNSAYNFIKSAKYNKEAKKILRNAGPRPEYMTPQSIIDNQSMAEAEASTGGMSDVANIAYTNKAERDFGNALNALLMAGGNVNNFADIYDKNQDAAQQLALLNEEIRSKKLQNLANQNQILAQYKDNEWQINQYKVWADAQAKAQALRDAASKRTDAGMASIALGLNKYGISNLYEKTLNKNNNPSINVNDVISGAQNTSASLMTPEQEFLLNILKNMGIDNSTLNFYNRPR